jgi:hypothetical protein
MNEQIRLVLRDAANPASVVASRMVDEFASLEAMATWVKSWQRVTWQFETGSR